MNMVKKRSEQLCISLASCIRKSNFSSKKKKSFLKNFIPTNVIKNI